MNGLGSLEIILGSFYRTGLRSALAEFFDAIVLTGDIYRHMEMEYTTYLSLLKRGFGFSFGWRPPGLATYVK